MTNTQWTGPAMALGACSDGCYGWIVGDHGVERCDDCRRFADDDVAADHVRAMLHVDGMRELAPLVRLLGPMDEPETRTVAACRECGSHNVQRLKLCWVDANGNADVRQDDVDHDSDPGLMGYSADTWCPDCRCHPSFDYLTLPVEDTE